MCTTPTKGCGRMGSPRRRKPLDLGECSDPVRFTLECVNPDARESEHRYARGVVITSHVDNRGNVHYAIDLFDIPPLKEQVAFARKICGIEGAVYVNDRHHLTVDATVLREHLTPEEYTLYCRLTNSPEACAELTSFISLARLEGQEGYGSATTVLDRYAQTDWFAPRERMTAEMFSELARALAMAI